MKKMLIIASILVLAGCGGGGSNGSSGNNQSSNTQKQSRGYYVDSSIIGADYVCGNLSGKTNNRGEFKFYQGDSCRFLIGDVKLREVKANELHDGITIYEHNLPVARVLQTLDIDGDPDNSGIEIASKSAECLKQSFNNKSYIPSSVNDEDIDKLYNCLKEDSTYNGKAVTQAEAQAHIKDNTPDTTPPVITLKGNDKITLEAGSNFTDPGAMAIDDRDGTVAVTVSGEVKNRTVGKYTLTYTAEDKAGNKATKTREVTVVDTTKPTITLKGANPITLQQGSTFNDPWVETSDNADGEVKVTVTGSVDTSKVEEYTLTYTATDKVGNEAKVTRVVKIINANKEINKTLAKYSNFYYKPDLNDNSLTYSIINKPDWLEFNATTGELKGVALDVGEFRDIEINASNGSKNFKVAKIDLNITDAIDIAHMYGKATQGTGEGYQYYQPPSNAIDNNDSTWNHTRGGANGENWLQIEIPQNTLVRRVVIESANNNAKRLEGAKVYLSDKPYAGDIDESTSIYTLKGIYGEQIITLDEPKSAKYILIKGVQSSSDNHHLHLKKVEVYGTLPSEPIFTDPISSLLISGNSEIGITIATLPAIDYQDDTITYTIVGNVPFSIDSNGNLTVSGELTDSQYTFDIKVSDGFSETIHTITINVTSKNAIEELLKTGDIIKTKVTQKELIEATREEIAKLKKTDSLLTQIYQDRTIEYNPGQSSQIIEVLGDSSKITPIIYGNNGHFLAVAGVKDSSRFAIFGSNPLYKFENEDNNSYEPSMKRVFAWLMGGEPIDMGNLDGNKSVVLSFATNTKEVKSWIGKNYPKWSIKECNDKDTLASCYEGSDLIIFGRNGNDEDAKALSSVLPTINKLPILYLHDSWGRNSLSGAIADYFEIAFPYAGNYFANDKAAWWNANDMYQGYFNSLGYGDIDKMLAHFQNEDFDFEWSKCKNSDGDYTENGDECSELTELNSEFFNGANAVRKITKALDSHKIRIFDKPNYRLKKLLVLLGDKFRQGVSYPMDKVKTDDTEFMKSLYSDHAIYNFRDINPTQPDMGNFSRSDFSTITPTNKNITITSKTPFRSAGVYVLPGQSVTIERTDSSDVATSVFINSLRSEATHHLAKNGYKRPKYLQSTHIAIKSGESITLTSPYGGPLQIGFNKSNVNVSFEIKNIGLHPVWNEFDTDPNKDAKFAEALKANKYDWAEIITSAFEVHSKRDKMLESINNFRWGSASALAEATKTYASSNPMALAGFKGPGIEVIDDIKRFADDNNITIYNADFVKHMNADQASCGFGCSGNPYDAYWAFDPISHGDIHEIGHSLERSKFRLKGWELHSSTNYYAYYTQMRYNQYVEQNGLDESYYITNNHVKKSVFQEQFDALKSCANSTDSIVCMQDYWEKSNYSSQSLFVIEAMMYAQKYASGDYALSNGFHLLGRLHTLERFLAKDAKKDWENNKEKLGFSTYSLSEIKKIDSNDWLVISLSWATGLDYRPFFDMYGEPYSAKANDQIESFKFPKVKRVFFMENNNSGFILPDEDYPYLNKPEMAIDSEAVNVVKGESFSKKLTFSDKGKLSLNNAPKGMAIYPNGTLTWTPTNDQAGEHKVTVVSQKEDGTTEEQNLTIKVDGGDIDYKGLFVDLSGAKDSGDGTPTNPYGTYEEACANLNGAKNIYLRGGVYYNPGFKTDNTNSGRYPAVKNCVGSADNPIVIRPWGNEYVKLKTDALYGVKVDASSKHLTLQNIEVEGMAQDINLTTALKHWWDKNDTLQGSGIVANGDYIEVKDCVVHDMPGSGISATAGAYAKLSNNIVYNCDWWTIAGSKGIGITSAKDDPDNKADGAYKNQITNNLIFNIEQRVMSHVWKKGFATLSIDEGEAFLIQEGKRQDGTTSSSYSGRYLIKNNLILYNGKTGVINLTKNVDVENNSYYNNGASTQQAGFRVNTGEDIHIKNNAVEANIADTFIYSVASNSEGNVTFEDNYAKGTITRNGETITGIEAVATMFKDPQNFDFSFANDSNIPSNVGIEPTVQADIKKRIELYNIEVKMQHLDINQTAMTEAIIANRPAGSTVDCSHYNDVKPYVMINNIPDNHQIVQDTGKNSFKLNIEHKGECKE